MNIVTRHNRIKPADIILVNSGTSYGSLVLRVLRLLQEDDVKLSHALMAINEETAIAAESRVRFRNIEEYLSMVKDYKIIRNNKLTDAQRESIAKKAETLLNIRYGILRIALQLLDQVFHTNIFTRWLKDKKIQICSTLVSWAYYVVARITFNGVPWQSVEPDDIDDESLRNIEDWDFVDGTVNTWRL